MTTVNTEPAEHAEQDYLRELCAFCVECRDA